MNIHSNFIITLHQAPPMFIKPQFRISPIAKQEKVTGVSEQ